MSLYIGLIVFGVLISFGSFLFAAVNMLQHVEGFFDAVETPRANSLGGVFQVFARHIGAMIGMVGGGGLAAIGVLLAACEFFDLL